MRPPLKKIKVYTTALIIETEEPFKEGVGRGSYLLELPIAPWERCCVIRPDDAPGLGTSLITCHPVPPVCSPISCSVSSHISLLSSPERPANGTGLPWESKMELTVGIPSRPTSELPSLKRKASFVSSCRFCSVSSQRCPLQSPKMYVKFPRHPWKNLKYILSDLLESTNWIP